MFTSQGNSGNDDGITALKAIVLNLSALASAFQIGNVGTFTMPAAALLVVPNAFIVTGAYVFLTPLNAAAATLQGSNEHLYIDPADYVASVSFTVRTAAGTAAAGTEQFAYRVVNVG